jgi:hypothetical protein
VLWRLGAGGVDDAAPHATVQVGVSATAPAMNVATCVVPVCCEGEVAKVMRRGLHVERSPRVRQR